jgi:tripartite ATP-independent transporter DctM subunit
MKHEANDQAAQIPGTDTLQTIQARRRGFSMLWRWGVRLENAVVIVTLLAMILLPIWGSCLRLAGNVWRWYLGNPAPSDPRLIQGLDLINRFAISGMGSMIQHGSLIVGLVGGAIAARQNRLLSLATATMLPPGWPQRVARVFAGAVGAVVSAMLALASYQFLLTEREAGYTLAYDVPRWWVECVLPIGFALIAVRILWHAADGWIGRGVALLLAGGMFMVCAAIEQPPDALAYSAMAALLIATVFGTPIFATLGGFALIFFWWEQSPIAAIPIAHYSLVVNPTLPTIPLFTLAGYILAEGGASRRLVGVFETLLSSIRGGPAIVTVVVCAFFTSFTGASGVTILALGGLLMPILLAARYSERAALGLLTGSGALGMLFPPCLPLILYSIIAQHSLRSNPQLAAGGASVTIEGIFLAAIVPGIMLTVMTAALGVWMGPARQQRSDARAFSISQASRAIWTAKWELLVPVVALASLFGGLATPVEAAAITAAYALFTQFIVWRDLRIVRDLPRVFIECGLVIGGVLLILGVAQGLTNYLIDAMVPDRAVEWVTASVKSPLMFLLLLNLFLLIVGCLMDVYSAIVVVVPLLIPIAFEFNVDPLHLGVIFLANLELGFLTPPVGMNLFLSSYRFNKPLMEVARSIVPILILQLIGVLLITYVPALTTALPRWFGY